MRGIHTRHCGGGSAINTSKNVFSKIFFWQSTDKTLLVKASKTPRQVEWDPDRFKGTLAAIWSRLVYSHAEESMFSQSARCSQMTAPRTPPWGASTLPSGTGQIWQRPSPHLSLISGKIYLKETEVILSYVNPSKNSNILKIHLFHTKYSSNLLTYFDISLTDIKIIIKLVHSAHFLILCLKCELISLYRIVWSLYNTGL